MIKSLSFILISFSLSASASVDNAWSILKDNKGNVESYPKVVKELVKNGLYFTSIPLIKEYLTSGTAKTTKEIDSLIDQVVSEVGIMQFEVLPLSVLSRTEAPMISYIMAKKYFHMDKYQEALKVLNKAIPGDHPAKPFSLLLEASSLNILKQYESALNAYKECIQSAESNMSKFNQPNRLTQLSITRDYCIVGIGRTYFANGYFDNANFAYLDLSKSSYVWPELLFDEAWNSFYQKDYNRTLGKLVTYKAPVLNFIFNPEIDVLRALTFLELCLYDDASAVVNEFYDKYKTQTEVVENLLKKHDRDYKAYYLLSKNYTGDAKQGSDLLSNIMRNIVRDAAFIELNESFQNAREEIKQLKTVKNAQMRNILSNALKESLVLQRDLIGAYVRKLISLSLSKLTESFKGMSFIRLEVLGMKKSELYLDTQKDDKRGDIKYLKRNDKQYFWDFIGEFWADELGDYVFSLKTECRTEDK